MLTFEQLNNFLATHPAINVWELSRAATGSPYTIDKALKRGGISKNLSAKLLPILIKYGYMKIVKIEVSVSHYNYENGEPYGFFGSYIATWSDGSESAEEGNIHINQSAVLADEKGNVLAEEEIIWPAGTFTQNLHG